MNAITKLQKLEESKKLPLGHYGRIEAQKIIDLEYSKCHIIENYRFKKIKKYFKTFYLEPQYALRLCDKICDSIKTKRIKKIILNVSSIRYAGAIYQDKEIKFPYKYIIPMHLFHELAHHLHREDKIQGSSHGEEFCFYINIVYDILEDIIKKEK